MDKSCRSRATAFSSCVPEFVAAEFTALQAAEMEALERDVLASLGIDDPYADGSGASEVEHVHGA